jgi:D-aminopeptidase
MTARFPRRAYVALLPSVCLAACMHAQATPATSPPAGSRPRARALGIAPGIFRPGAANAITDVAGVRVGHATRVIGDSVRTGVTAILPHGDNPYLERVPAAIWVGNGFGKLVGISQLRELGELESPVLLTCTLCTWKAADALAEWMLARPRMERVRSINVVVGETNDGRLNSAIRSRPVDAAAVREALESASAGPVTEGSVGAGAGTIAFGWKGGIGTSSRVLPHTLGGYTVGVLVQSNFGGVLQVMGAPVGRELGQYAFRNDVEGERGDGSIMMVVATDAPLSDRNLERLAARAIMGLAHTGSAASNGSGDYVIAFSTSPLVRRHFGPGGVALTDSTRLRTTTELTNDDMSALFQGVSEATEEAIYNSLTTATTVSAREGTVEALPIPRLVEVLRKYGIIR